MSEKKMSVGMATMLVAGNMMGSGVFLLPANLAKIGSIATWGWIVTTGGALLLALVFAKLAQIDPKEGGPYAYARDAFGPYMGFQTNYVYWFASWIGNVALAVGATGYFSNFVPLFKQAIPAAILNIAIIWFFTYANILGPRLVGQIQSWTTSLALIPILGTAIFGWFFFDLGNFTGAYNVSGGSDGAAISSSAALTLWAFIGVESASVSAGVVENPRRNVPIATVGGVVLAAVAYILSSSVIMGIIPNDALQVSSAPFADAAFIALGPVGSAVVTVCAMLACGGSLGGWTLLVGQTAKAAADDGMFPKMFAVVNSRGVPARGLIAVAIMMSAVVVLTLSPNAADQFGMIASLAVILTLLPYLYSAAAVWLALDQTNAPSNTKKLFAVVGWLAVLYSLWAISGNEARFIVYSFLALLLSVPLYHYFRGGTAKKPAAVKS